MVPPKDSDRSFLTTPWSLLSAVRQRSHLTEAQTATSWLCEIYWRPIYTFIANRGYDLDETKDLTQSFMVYLLQRQAFASADKTRGKFRSYVLGILKHFLAHVRQGEQTQKRGGGTTTLPLDEVAPNEIERSGARRGPVAPPHPLDVQWAVGIKRRVEDRIAGEYAASQRSELYLALRRHLTSEKSVGSYKEDARRLGRPVATVRSDVARMRRRYSEILLEELRKEAPAADLRQELLHYFRIIAMSG